MSKRFYRLTIEDLSTQDCTMAEQQLLLEVFGPTVKLQATTLARKAEYHLQDFYGAKDTGIDDFSLTIERRKICGQEQWWGEFASGTRTMHVVGVLEK